MNQRARFSLYIGIVGVVLVLAGVVYIGGQQSGLVLAQVNGACPFGFQCSGYPNPSGGCIYQDETRIKPPYYQVGVTCNVGGCNGECYRVCPNGVCPPLPSSVCPQGDSCDSNILNGICTHRPPGAIPGVIDIFDGACSNGCGKCFHVTHSWDDSSSSSESSSTCVSVECADPVQGCHYEGATTVDGCQTSCGQLVCSPCNPPQHWNGNRCITCLNNRNWNGAKCVKCNSRQHWNGNQCVL